MGNVRLVRPNRNLPYFEELRTLLLKTYGPVAVLSGPLREIDGVEEAYVFGSWARRYEGEAGLPPGDIDLLLVGDPDPDHVYGACRKAEEHLRNAVNPSILTPAEWRKSRSGLARAVKEGPRVPVIWRAD